MYEQHLAVLGQWPEFVVDDEFQLVDVAAYLFDERCYGVVVGNGTLSVVLDAVGNTTGFDEAFHILDDEGIVLANLLDETHVGAIEAFGFFCRQDGLHLANVVDELCLVACFYFAISLTMLGSLALLGCPIRMSASPSAPTKLDIYFLIRLNENTSDKLL